MGVAEASVSPIIECAPPLFIDNKWRDDYYFFRRTELQTTHSLFTPYFPFICPVCVPRKQASQESMSELRQIFRYTKCFQKTKNKHNFSQRIQLIESLWGVKGTVRDSNSTRFSSNPIQTIQRHEACSYRY